MMGQSQALDAESVNLAEQSFREAAQLLEADRFSDAACACLRAVEQDPRHAPALHLLGVLALEAREFPRAIELLERALVVAEEPAYLSALASAYRSSARPAEALAVLGRARELAPQRAETWHGIGLVRRERKDLAGARAAFEQAVKLAPRTPTFHADLGAVLAELGEFRKAAEHLEAVTILEPESAEARFAVARALGRVGDNDGAIAHCQYGLELEPTNARAHNHLGNLLSEVGQLDESASSFERAIALEPDLARAHGNLGNTLRALGRVESAVAAYRRAHALEPRDCQIHSNLLFALEFDPNSDDAAILAEARRWNALHAAPVTPVTRRHRRRAWPGRRLRLGYVSADFQQHVQALFVLPLLEHHDRNAFEVYAYSNVPMPDGCTELHREAVDHFRDISQLDHDASARLIDEDSIDVLIDLTMHMANSRLLTFARRPAPVQVSWLAYPGTTGVSAIDYRFTDPHIDPPGTAACSSERTHCLPDSFWCFRALRPAEPTIEPGSLPARSNGYVTFGCLNSFAKVNDDVLALWGRVLAAVADSRLLILAPRGSARVRVAEHLARAGVGSERISFVDYQARHEYLQTFRRIDIALDTLPATGHTTSLDTWWMGVPVLSLVGRTIAGRAGLAYAANLGLREWCVEDVESYVAAAQRFAADLDGLARLRAQLRGRMQASPLMDVARFARNLEAAYGKMWAEWYAGQSS